MAELLRWCLFLCSLHSLWFTLLLTWLTLSISAATTSNPSAREYVDQPRRILLPLPLLAKAGSHCSPLRVISSALAKRGHYIKLLRSSEEPCGILDGFNASEVLEYNVPDNSAEFKLARAKGQEVAASHDQFGLEKIRFFWKVCGVFANRCRDLLTKKDLLEDLRNQNFDIIITDLFSPCYALLAEYLNLPLIVVTTSREYPIFYRQMFGFPSELSYVPEYGSGLSSQLDLIGKLKNIASRFMCRIMGYACLQYFRAVQFELDIKPSSSLNTIMSNRTKLWLSYSSLALDYPEPVMPNTVFVGGMAIMENKPLSKELEEFIQGSGDHGLIIFSLGSMISSLGDHVNSIIANTFRQLPQRVIWKHEGVVPQGVGNNTLVLDWIPQNDLLGHPKTRLFIGHGGINGVYEALYHGVPMLLIPVMSPDQWDNAVRVESKGLGKSIDIRSISNESLYNDVTDVLHNKRYRESVLHHSAILRDLPTGPDQAVFWIEHVLKFGDKHLRASVFELNFIQYYLIDVALAVLLVVIISFLTLRFIFRLCCGACVGKKPKIE
ncbi:UDP-glucuronosyltransferase 2C1-like [Amphiura filiformis]|uniref:UDP-glucuronosyltransferase 2C1-like n=1 Tax=Amphiura filiformis TaxID=82378 RepID=UPI003B22361F